MKKPEKPAAGGYIPDKASNNNQDKQLKEIERQEKATQTPERKEIPTPKEKPTPEPKERPEPRDK